MASAGIKYWTSGIAVLFGTLFFIFIVDRVLLAEHPLPRWQGDAVLHYKLRPGNYTWGRRYDKKPIVINRHGFHDDDFEEHKENGELRGLILGDSIVMGHGVTAAETFANQLERLLPEHAPGYTAYQVINTGVEGYSTFQYLETMKRTLKYLPDFIVVGFCMNDVTEPYIVNKDYGGSGLDYHGILQVSHPWLGYLVNETGFGRFAIHIRKRITGKFQSAEDLVKKEARKEIYNVRKMSRYSRTEQVYIDAWKNILSDLSEMYQLATTNKIPMTLIIFPHTFQITDDTLKEPQRILKEHAQQHRIPYLDMTEVAGQLLREGVPLEELFLDQDHYTATGHRVVSKALLVHLKFHGII